MPGELPFNARVFIANFGKENYLWPECLSTPCIATLDDEDLRDYWMTGNRRGYIEHCLRTKLTVRGLKPNRALASRWFNVHTTLSESSGDIWIHREKDDFWWAISGSQPITEDVRPPYKALPSAPNSIVRRKQTTPWSNKDLTGRRLSWKTLHPKAQTFLFTEGTLQQVGHDHGYADYSLAPLQGTDLSPWHGTTDWRVFEARRSVSRGTVLSPVEAAIALMASQARDTASRANGQEVLAKVKNKEFGFDSDEEMRVYLRNLLNDQEGLCAISGLRFQYPGQIDDPELQCSLDRIDSDGHYAAGNLQIVCRFINRWKSSSDDAEFRRLVRVLRASVDFEGIS
ncbi:hypothetical protein SAMN05443580_10964 [Variovorax sp. OV084]|jgi:hypothetical protein|nr:hypothetical protein SAMN05443580_10964 [Variovorax sp. OV084]